MKNLWIKLKNIMFFILITLITTPVFADLPKPPSNEIVSDNKDAIDVGSVVVVKGIKFTCIFFGVIILLGAAGGIMRSYQVAHEKQDLGYFFKMLIISLIAAALGLGLVYAGYSIIPSST